MLMRSIQWFTGINRELFADLVLVSASKQMLCSPSIIYPSVQW